MCVSTAEAPPSRAAVVVVGAGVIGCAVALELRRAGIGGVVVLDANPSPGMGSSGRANGGVRAQFATAVNVEFSRFTIAGLAALDRESGGRVGYRAIGYLLMTGTEAGEAALDEALVLQRALGVDVTRLLPRQVLAILPMIERDGLRAANLCAGDGVIDPHGVVGTLCDAARSLGATFVFGCRVTSIDWSAGRAVVHSDAGATVAEHVVNAAGPSARAVAALGGISLPVQPYRRNLVCTEAVTGLPDVIPMCVDMDTGVLIRREGSGVLAAYSDPADAPSTDTAFDDGFLEVLAARAQHRFPFLAGVRINPRKCWAGLYPETPDHHAIVDAPPPAPWFVQCAGFGGHGIMHSLAAGRAVAELIRDGRCSSFDLRPLRLARFAEGDVRVETTVL